MTPIAPAKGHNEYDNPVGVLQRTLCPTCQQPVQWSRHTPDDPIWPEHFTASCCGWLLNYGAMRVFVNIFDKKEEGLA